MNIHTVISRDGKLKGKVINPTSRRCGVEDCVGTTYSVRWEDGRISYPCSEGLQFVRDGVYQIM